LKGAVDAEAAAGVQDPPLTVEALAEEKGFDPAWLEREFGLEQHGDKVEIPYHRADGSSARSRLRGKTRQGDGEICGWDADAEELPIVAYGLDRLAKIKTIESEQTADEIYLVDDEADVWTFAVFGHPSLEIPTAGKAAAAVLRASETLEQIKRFPRVAICQSAGDDGKRFAENAAKALRECGYRGRVRAIEFEPERKNPNALYVDERNSAGVGFPTALTHLRWRRVAMTDDPHELLEPLDLSHIFEFAPEPLDFVLPGLLAGTVGAVVSPGGTGKSMTVLELLLWLACGADLLGLEAMGAVRMKPCKVVYYAAEDPDVILRHRLFAMGAHLSPSERAAVRENLGVWTLLGHKQLLTDEKFRRGVIQRNKGARLIVCDTFRRFHNADENDSGDMSEVVSALEEIAVGTGAAVLYLHHANKGWVLNEGAGGEQQQSSRGSSVLPDHTRWQMHVVGMSEAQSQSAGVDAADRHRYCRLVFVKHNYSAKPADVWLQRDPATGVLLASALSPSADADNGKPAKGRILGFAKKRISDEHAF
jgi:hypothetical protein